MESPDIWWQHHCALAANGRADEAWAAGTALPDCGVTGNTALICPVPEAPMSYLSRIAPTAPLMTAVSYPNRKPPSAAAPAMRAARSARVASRGSGTTLNNKRIRVSKVKELEDSLIGTGVPIRNPEMLDSYLPMMRRVAEHTAGLRRAGSAALDLAYVAAGRFDAMVCRNIKPWDMAAGILLVKEAGGFVADPDGDKNPMDTGNILATNADLLPQFKDALSKARET